VDISLELSVNSLCYCCVIVLCADNKQSYHSGALRYSAIFCIFVSAFIALASFVLTDVASPFVPNNDLVLCPSDASDGR